MKNKKVEQIKAQQLSFFNQHVNFEDQLSTRVPFEVELLRLKSVFLKELMSSLSPENCDDILIELRNIEKEKEQAEIYRNEYSAYSLELLEEVFNSYILAFYLLVLSKNSNNHINQSMFISKKLSDVLISYENFQALGVKCIGEIARINKLAGDLEFEEITDFDPGGVEFVLDQIATQKRILGEVAYQFAKLVGDHS
jgi:hypothetical protein